MERDREREVRFPSPFAGAIYISGRVTMFFFLGSRGLGKKGGALWFPTSLVYRPSNQKARGKEAS